MNGYSRKDIRKLSSLIASAVIKSQKMLCLFHDEERCHIFPCMNTCMDQDLPGCVRIANNHLIKTSSIQAGPDGFHLQMAAVA